MYPELSIHACMVIMHHAFIGRFGTKKYMLVMYPISSQ